MEINEIRQEVEAAVDKWLYFKNRIKRKYYFSEGAIDTIIHMVENIKRDPSEGWNDVNYNDVQIEVIQTLPNILNDIFRTRPIGMGRGERLPLKHNKISSWELLHGISEALNKWCPIPKDI